MPPDAALGLPAGACSDPLRATLEELAVAQPGYQATGALGTCWGCASPAAPRTPEEVDARLFRTGLRHKRRWATLCSRKG